MKIGINLSRRDDGTPSYFGFTKYPARSFAADVPVPESVERCIELSEGVWSKNNELPVATILSGGHGGDMGLVILAGYNESHPHFNFTRSEIATRISFGKKSEGRGKTMDYSDIDRLHINVYGTRMFFPEDWRKVISKKNHNHNYSWGIDLRPYTWVKEQVHISFRWLDGEFDDWNDMKQWTEQVNYNSSARKTFDNNRTTYGIMEVETSFRSPDGNSPAEKKDKLEESVDYRKRILKSEGRKKRHFSQGRSLKMFGNDKNHPMNAHLHRLWGYGGIMGRQPLVGIGAVTSNLGMDYRGLHDITLEESVEYLFGEVLPGVEAYLKK